MRKPACFLVALCVLLYASVAHADPAPAPTFLEWVEPTVLCYPGNVGCITLAPGYYLSKPTYNVLDTEMRRLQEQETRLIAENNSLRSTADSVPWPALAVATTIGICLGVYVGLKF